MSLCDPVADMLTRIRNASSVRRASVMVKASKVCEGIAAILKEEGYIVDYDRVDDGSQGQIRVTLKYSEEGLPVFSEMKRISKPGRRVYSTVHDMPHVLGGMGIAIVSTSKGVISDRSCRKDNVGGEILCTVS